MSAHPNIHVDAIGPTFKFKPLPIVWRKEATYFLMGICSTIWLAVILMWFQDFFHRQYRGALPEKMGYMLVFVGLNFMTALVLRRYLMHMKKPAYFQFRIMLVGSAIGILVSIILMPILRETGEGLNFDLGRAFSFNGPRVPTTIVIAPLVLLFWQRGFSLGRVYINMTAASLQMRVGILVFFFFGAFSTREVSDQFLAVLPIFFAAGLLATALSRSATLKVEDDTQRARFGVTWFGFLTLTVVVIVSGGFLFALVLAGVDQENAKWGITALLTVMVVLSLARTAINLSMLGGCVAVAVLITLASGYVVRQLLVQETDEDNIGVIEGGPIVNERAEGTGENLVRDFFDLIGNITGLGFVLFCVILPIVFWILIFFLRDNELFDDEDSELLDRREIIAGIRKGLGNRLRRIGDALKVFGQFGGRDLLTALSVRWTYTRMAGLAEKRGFPRGKAETPNEYRLALGKAFPGGEGDIRLITAAYVAVRYGELPEDNEQLNVIREAFERLKAIHPAEG